MFISSSESRLLDVFFMNPLVDDNPSSGRPSTKHSILEVDQTNHHFLEADNGSSPLAYSIPGARATSVAPGIKSIRNSTCRADGIPGKSLEILQENLEQLTSTLIACENSLILISSMVLTIPGYVTNILAIFALYSARPIVVHLALVAQRASIVITFLLPLVASIFYYLVSLPFGLVLPRELMMVL
ncbi:hypothetical protein Tco_0275756 [Tanacetum coccineum]